jgi:hypothetical protein
MIPVLLALAALAPQGEPPAEKKNPILDGVAVQAGEALVTFSELDRALKRAREVQPPSSAEEEERQRKEVLLYLWVRRLEEQAGADLGLDPAQIDRISRLNLEAQRDKEGLEAYLAGLRSRGKDALAEESDRYQEVLRYMWEQDALGRPFAAKRATRDHAIRPGELRAIFEENKERMAPVTVQLRVLIVSSQSVGSPEAARASCEEARALVLAGEDMALIVEERGAGLRDSRGLTPFHPVRALYPELAAFAEKAEVGDLAEVMPYVNPETGKPDPELGYQLVELHDRRAPPIPMFATTEVQIGLREQFSRQRENVILERERERLRRESHSWVSPQARALIGGPFTRQ